MKVADLFINLGIKGIDGVGKGLKATKTGLDDLVSSSLAAKAAILGVIVGLERMTGAASQRGMDLYKFQAATGLSAKELQNWQHAAMHFDVSADEMANTLSGLQSTMTDMLMGKGAPEALGLFSQFGVDLDPTKMRDTFYMMEKIREFSKKAPPDVAKNLLKSLNINENMLPMLKAMNWEKDKISKKDIITDREISKLKDINVAWKDFWFTLQTMGTKFVAENGLGAVEEIKNAFQGLVYLKDQLMKLVELFPTLKYIALGVLAAIGAAFAPITAAVVAIGLALSDFNKFRTGKESFIGKGIDWIKDLTSPDNKKPNESAPLLPGLISGNSAAAPPMSTQPSVGQEDNRVINMNNYFQGDIDKPKENASHINKQVSDAFYSSPLMSQQNRTGK